MKKEMVEIQQNVVQNQTAVMIEIGTSLLNQTAAQTRKLTDVEAQVSGTQKPWVQHAANRPCAWAGVQCGSGKLQTPAGKEGEASALQG